MTTCSPCVSFSVEQFGHLIMVRWFIPIILFTENLTRCKILVLGISSNLWHGTFLKVNKYFQSNSLANTFKIHLAIRLLANEQSTLDGALFVRVRVFALLQLKLRRNISRQRCNTFFETRFVLRFV